MSIYVVVEYSLYPNFIGSYWKKADAEKAILSLQERVSELRFKIISVYLPRLSELVKDYYQFRDYKDPDLQEAFNWLVSEVGEAAGVINQTQAEGWVRNNDHAQDSLADELGDVLMMLIKTAEKADVDLLDAMTDKWKRKGWTP